MSYNRAGCQCDISVVCNECGVGDNTLLPPWCGVVTDSSCPATLAVGFTIPEHELIVECSGVPQVLVTYPSWEGAISVAMNETNNCAYTGEDVTSVSVTTNPCGGGGVTYTQRTITVSLLSSGFYSLAVIPSPCADTIGGSVDSPCAGLIVAIGDEFKILATGAVVRHDWTLAYKKYDIEDCTVLVPCHTMHGGAANLYTENPTTLDSITTATIT
jgi:hypothetical protein